MKLFTIVFGIALLGQAALAKDLDTDLAKVKVTLEIAKMWGEDQALRHGRNFLKERGHKWKDVMKHPEYAKQWNDLHRRNTEALKVMIEEWGWPSISGFGHQADDQAWLLVQNSDDLVFQAKVLKLLEEALANKDTNPRNFAFLWDHVHYLKKGVQRYGTQGHCNSKTKQWEPYKLDDSDDIDALRKGMKLDTFKGYIESMNRFCSGL